MPAFKVPSLAWMLVIVCSCVVTNVPIATTPMNRHCAPDCPVVEDRGFNESLNDNQHETCEKENVWVNMTGCFNGDVDSSQRSISLNDTIAKDPVVYCFQECFSDNIFLTSTRCYCGGRLNKSAESPCRMAGYSRKCGDGGGYVDGGGGDGGGGSVASITNNDMCNECICGYEKTNITTNGSQNCMSTKIVGGTFKNIAENCDRNMSAVCTTTQNAYSYFPDKKINWMNALYSCENGQQFVGVKNSSKATFNANKNNSYWVGMFRIELLRTPCKTLNVSSNTLIPQTSTQPSLSTTSNAQEHTRSSGAMKTASVMSSPSSKTLTSSLMSSSSSMGTVTISSTIATEKSFVTSSIGKVTETSPMTSPFSTEIATKTSPKIKVSSNTKGTTTSPMMSSTHTQQTTKYETSSSSPDMNVNMNNANNEFPIVIVGAGTGGVVITFIVSLTVAFLIYRRRKNNRNNNPEEDLRDSFDDNSINVQQTSTAINGHIKYGRNTECNNERESARDGVYDHLKGYQNNKTSVAFSNSAYDHVTPYRITSQTVRDDNTYDNFSRKKEHMIYSGDDYDHVVRHSDTYDHLRKMGNVTMDTASENYDHVSGRFLKSPDKQSKQATHYDNFTPR